DPSPQVAAFFAHAILDVKFTRTVARPGQRQSVEKTGRVHAQELVLVEEVAVAALMAEEQPVAARRLHRHTIVQEGAERRDAGAGTDHDYWHGRIVRQCEALRPARGARRGMSKPPPSGGGRPMCSAPHRPSGPRAADRFWESRRSSRAAAAARRAIR